MELIHHLLTTFPDFQASRARKQQATSSPIPTTLPTPLNEDKQASKQYH